VQVKKLTSVDRAINSAALGFYVIFSSQRESSIATAATETVGIPKGKYRIGSFSIA